MRVKVDDHVTVWLSDAGMPERLVWRGRRWLVTDRPTPWVDRDRWWEQAAGEGPVGVSGFPVWRAQISPSDAGGGNSVVVDIAHRANAWIILNVFD